MNTVYYSPSTGGFYLPEIHGENIPADAVRITSEQHRALLQGQAEGSLIVPGPGGAPVLKAPDGPDFAQRSRLIEVDVQSYMDSQAQAVGYDDLKTAVTYAEEPAVQKFQAEGRALRAWRSLVWARCYELLAEVQAGERVEPTSQQVIALLPPPPVFPSSINGPAEPAAN